MSSGFFNYQADRETMLACAALIERSRDRMRRGGPVCMGDRKANAMGSTSRERQSYSQRLKLPAEIKARIFSLWSQGWSRKEIAAEVGCSESRVQTLTCRVPREAKLRRAAA